MRKNFFIERMKDLKKKRLRKKNKNGIIKYNNKKEGKMSYNKDTSSNATKGKYTTTPTTTFLKPDHPKLSNIEYNPSFTKKKNFKFAVSELVKGVSFCATYFRYKEDFEINYHRDEEKSYINDLRSLEANINAKTLPLYKPMRKLAGLLGGGEVNFTVFLEYITLNNQKCNYMTSEETAKVLVYDIFINENWVSFDVLKEICDICGLETMPILYHGEYNEKIIDTFLYQVPSSFNGAEKYGLIVKSSIEDTEKNKRVAEVLINKRFKKEIVVASSYPSITFSKEEISKKVGEEIDEVFIESKRNIIDKNVILNFPGVPKDNIPNKVVGKVLSHAVNQTINFYFYSIEVDLFKKPLSKREKSIITKELRKQLSDIFIKRYGLFKKGE